MDSVLIDTKRLWTKSEYSKNFGISRATIDKWIEEKRLKSVRVNGTTLIIH
jgi:excisionase family DNA binding protein